MPNNPPTCCARCLTGPCVCKPEDLPKRPKRILDDVDKRYNHARWRKFSQLIRDLNPICQHIINGVQHNRPSQLVHHLVSPKDDESKLTDPANVVAICWNCHITTQGEQQGAYYAPTKWIMGAVFKHEQVPASYKGRVGPHIVNGIICNQGITVEQPKRESTSFDFLAALRQKPKQ
jgi:hypothetical protein